MIEGPGSVTTLFTAEQSGPNGGRGSVRAADNLKEGF